MKKRIFTYLFLLALTLSLCCASTLVLAATGTTYYCDNTTYSYTPSSETTTDHYGVSYTQSFGTTNGGGYQNLSVFMMKTDGATSKLVTWAASDGSEGYNRAPLSEIAKDYEAKHPGWIVVAGINSDQYYPSYGTGLGTTGKDNYVVQPYYPMVMDGERVFPYTPYGNSTGNYVGFANNNTVDAIVEPSTIAGAYVEILDESGAILSEYPVSAFNTAADAGTTTVWSALSNGVSSTVNGKRVDYKYTYETRLAQDATGLIYIISDPEMAYTNNAVAWQADKTKYNGVGVDSFFGKGTISRMSHNATLSGDSFAIDTQDASLQAALAIGTRVRVQFRYASAELNACEAASGYHTVQVKDGKDNLSAANSYNNNGYPRSVFGQTADGTYFLMASDGVASNYSYTVDGKKITGLNWGQIDAVCDEFGVTEAYQDDGGGSVTAILRNDKGTFDVVDNPSEGSERYIMAGLFFVVKDPEASLVDFTVTPTAITTDAITLSVSQSSAYKATASDIVVTLGETSAPLEADGTVTFTGLTKNTESSLSITYQANGEEGHWAGTSVSSGKNLPGVYGVALSMSGSDLVVTPLYADPDGAIVSITLRVGSTSLLITGKTLTVANYNNETLRLIVTYKLSSIASEEEIQVRNPDQCAVNALAGFQKILLDAVKNVLS